MTGITKTRQKAPLPPSKARRQALCDGTSFVRHATPNGFTRCARHPCPRCGHGQWLQQTDS